MQIRAFEKRDAPALAELSAYCGRGESDFVLNPYWETEEELFAEFERFGIAPEENLLVADAGDGEVLGLVGFLRHPGGREAGLCVPIVPRASSTQYLWPRDSAAVSAAASPPWGNERSADAGM